ncbi:Alkaline phosphatase [Burkholderiales bacterium 8X]|nr:Alkaline phosphatase [Burkholderiales bacterium 8X]
MKPNRAALPSSEARRTLLRASLAAASLGFPLLRLGAQTPSSADPFALGVASGYPREDGVVLWTRLLAAPLRADSAGEPQGLGSRNIEVKWEVATDERFRLVSASGRVQALAAEAHSVHVDVRGLQPGRDHWYRFEAGGERSPVGRTRTAPSSASAQRGAPAINMAFAACQQYEQGFYAAYRDMAERSPDLVVHLGDYVYESSWGSRHVRKHGSGVPATLAEFRDRYAIYKSDPDLKAAHAAAPWLVTWDDHEVANDYTDDISPRTPDPAEFLAMRAAAYQAWYEHMPVPPSMKPKGALATIHGRYRFGQMLDVLMLDTRQHRSHHACGATSGFPVTDCDERSDPQRSMLGMAQEAWLARELAQPPTRWTLIAQSTLLATADRKAGPERSYWMDGWDGYPAARTRLLEAVAAHRPRNTVVIGGDVHAFYAADLKPSADAAPIATEFVGGSISSEGPPPGSVATLLAENPHVRFGRSDKRGYALMSLDARGCEVEFRAVEDVKQRESKVATLARFAVEDGKAGVQPG